MDAADRRIPPLPPAEWSEAAREAFATISPQSPANLTWAPDVAGVMAHHPALARAFFGMGRQLLLESTLPDRQRELVTLRVTSRYQGGAYEHHHHSRFARQLGLTQAEIEAASAPLETAGFTGLDRAVLQAADELIATGTLSDGLWEELGRDLERRQLMDLVFTVGLYVMASFANAALGIEIEDTSPTA